MKKFLLPIFLLLFVHQGISQTLEEINFSPNASIALNTYTTDINNKGFVCGYYESISGDKIGYVITPLGKNIVLSANLFPGSYQHISVEGINDSSTIIINATTSSGSIDIYKGYFNKLTQSYNLQAVSGNGQPGNAKPFGINNKNVYSGWYPNLTDRWGFMLNDSNASSLATWSAKRYNLLPSYLFKGNDNELFAGYHIDAGLNTPMVYDAQSNTFDVLPFVNNMKPRDLNNNNVICGEYRQSNGVYCGFYGTYSTGMVSNFSSINSLFSSTSVQNIINAVNDSLAFVGSYLHPVTNTWVGFIYRPNVNEYRLPQFSYAKDTWTKLLNNAGSGPTDVFSPNYYNNFNYTSVDPFVYNGHPLTNSVLQSLYNPLVLPKSLSVSWRGFCEESNLGTAAKIANATNVLLYENNFKPLLFAKYSQAKYINGFSGYCFGFSFTALLKKYRPDLFNLWYDKPVNFDISTAQNTDTVSVLAIERGFLKQYDPVWGNQMFPITTSYWRGMYRFKNEYLKDSATTNPQSLGMGLGVNAFTPPLAGHNVMPYKIRTPKKFPFDYPTVAMDTLYIYDSNYPNDSSQFFRVRAPFVENGGDTAININYTSGTNNAYQIRFQKVGVRDTIVSQYSTLNKTRSAADSMFKFTIEGNLNYTATNSSSQSMTLNAGLFTNACSNILPVQPEGVFISKPIAFIADTNSNFNLSSSNYSDTLMHWSLHKPLLTMGIKRNALLSETDNSSLSHRMLTYGNPDNVSKNLVCYFIQVNQNATQATTVIANLQNLVQGDSILTKNPSDYVYTITKLGGNAITYNLNTFTFSNDTARQFSATNLSLNPNAAHQVNSFFGNGQTVVFVDEGLNGTLEDTLFVPQVPLGSFDVESSDSKKFTVYPIPVNDLLTIQAHEISKGNYDVVVADVNGKILLKQKTDYATGLTSTLDCSQLPSGNYFLFIRDAAEQVIQVEKFTKQ